jgi:iron complex outermembrane receptor protein
MIDDPRCANDFQGAGPYRNNGTKPLESTLDVWGAALNLAYEVSDASTFKWISSYRDIEWTGIRDADNTPLTILHTDQDVVASQWSQELQYTYQSDALTGVVGLYYFAQESDDIVTVELNPPPPGIQRDSDNNIVENDSWAAFTQWTYDFNERLSLTAGGRYTEETKRSYPDQFDYATPDVKQVPVMWYEDTFSDFTPSASITYRWTPEAMTYLSYSEGFKGGGWNSHFNAPLTPESQAALHEFKPEQAETIEAGFKLDLADNTLRLNGAVFTSDYTDMQVTYRGPCQPPAPCGVAPFILNAGEASIDGAELEATWAPTDALTIDASVGYLDATIDSLENIQEAILPPGLEEGNTLPFAPELQAHLGIAYAARLMTFEVTPRVDVSYQDTTYFDAVNTPEIAQVDTVTRVNASVAVAPAEGRWRLVLGVNNATDEVYPIAGNSSLSTGSGYAEIAYSRPREYYATATYDF